MGLSKPSNISGVANHNELEGRSDADGHPIGAVSGLQTDLNNKATAITNATNTANTASTNASTALSTAQTANTTANNASTSIGTLANLNTTAKSNLVLAINENFTNANNGKTLLASAINGKGGTANDGMTFSQLSDAVTAIPNIDEATGDALAGDVRAGKTFSTLVGNGITGTLAEKQGDNVALASSVSGTTLKLRAPAGIYDGVDDNITLTDADFIAGNIKSGIDLFGLVGSLDSVPTPAVADITLKNEAFSPGWATFRSENWAPYPGYPFSGSAYPITIQKSGIYRIKFGLGGTAGYIIKAKLYKNGVEYGTERTITTAGGSAYFTQDLSFNAGDILELYVWTSTTSYVGQCSGIKIGSTVGSLFTSGGVSW